MALLRLRFVALREVDEVRERKHEDADVEDEQGDRRVRVLGGGGERAEEPRREDAPAVGHDEEDRERGRAAHVRRGVVRDPRLQRRRRAVRARHQEEDRAVAHVAVGGPQEHAEADDAEYGAEEDGEAATAVAIGQEGNRDRH